MITDGDQLKNPLTKNNLGFTEGFIADKDTPGFIVFYNNKNNVNRLLGKNASKALTTCLTEKDDIVPNVNKGDQPDWNVIENEAMLKYGDS